MNDSVMKELQMQTFLKLNEGNKNCENVLVKASWIQCVSKEEFNAYNNFVLLGTWSLIILVIWFFVILYLKEK